MPWEENDNFIRSGHGNPDDYSTCRTTTFDDKLPKGIKAVYCKRKDNNKWETQSYLFPKSENWTMSEAKKWFKVSSSEINKNVTNFLVRSLIKSGKLPALVVKSPYGKMIRDGVVKLIVKTRDYKKYIDMPVAIAEENGKIYAMISLGNAIQINKRQFEVIIDKHNITDEELKKWSAENKEWNNNILYGYPFKIIKEFKVPIDFNMFSDKEDWIDRVSIVNIKIEDINEVELEKSNKGEVFDIHEKMHSLWNLLKNIDVTEKRIGTANLIVEKHDVIIEYFNKFDIEHKNIDSLDEISQKKYQVEKIIKQEGDKWVLYSSDGQKILGRHDTKEQALEQERAIKINKSKEFNKYVPICKIDDEKQIVYGEVLVPDTFDAQGHKMTVEEIEKACHWYMINSQKNKIMHKGDYIESSVVENWIVPENIDYVNPKGQKITVTKGTWMMATKIYNKDVWQDVKDGKLTGYSIGGLGRLEEVGE